MPKFAGFSPFAVVLAAFLALGAQAQAQTPFPFFDDLEDGAAETWTVPENSLWGLITTAAHSGNQAWAIRPDSNWQYVTLAAPVNLVPAANPFMSLWIRVLDGRASYRVEVSGDGGASWQRVIDTHYEQPVWARRQIDLNAYTTSEEVLVRVGVSRWTAGATFMFDDWRVDNAPVPTVIRLLDPSNNAFTIDWEESGAGDFARYRVVLDTDASGVNDRNTAASVVGRRERRVYDIEDQGATRLELDDVVFAGKRYFAKIYEQDTQGFWNQGSERTETQTTFAMETATAPLLQDFEGDNVQWAADWPWTLTQAAAGEEGHSSPTAWEDSPLGSVESNYANNASRQLVGQFDLSETVRPVLRFRHRYNFQSGRDFGYVEYSRDRNTWARIGEFTGVQGQWSQEEINLSELGRQSVVFLRFWLLSDGNTPGDGWHIDDVEIADQGGTASFPFARDMEDEDATRAEWLGSAWDLSTVAARASERSWSVQPNGVWQWLTLAPNVDISGATNPYLALWLSTRDGRVTYRVEVSTDGGANWTRLGETNIENANWARLQFSLGVFRGRDFRVRIGALRWTPGARLFVDDILIDDAPVPGGIRLSDLGNNALSLSWDASTAPDFSRYRIVLDNDQGGVNDIATEPFASDRRERRLFEFDNRSVTSLRFEDLLLVGGRYHAKIYEQDTQGFWNQGSVRVELQTLVQLEPEVAPFVQDFEGDDFLWAGDWPWSLTQSAAEEEGHSGTHAWEDSPLGVQANYAANNNRLLRGLLDLSRVRRPVLRFKHRYNFQAERDFGRVEVSRDGSNWTEIMQFTGFDGEWKQEEYDLSFYSRLERAHLRFRVTSDGNTQGDGWHIDDIEIAENERTADFPFLDDMENEAETQAGWLGSGWELRTTQAHSGDLAWEVTPGGQWTWKTLAGTVDLSRTSEPFLSLWLRTVGGRVSYRIAVSGNGGVNWTRLADTSLDPSNWTEFQASLADFRSNDVLVRIGALRWSSGASLQFDDVSISFPPTVFGDASGDKEVTAFDAALILQHAVGLRTLRGPALDAADVSGNGRVSPYDAALVLQFVTGLIEAFPVEDDGASKAVPVAARLRWGTPEVGDNGVYLPLEADGRPEGAGALRAEIELPDGVLFHGVAPALPDGWTLVHRVEGGVLHLAAAGSAALQPGPLARLRLGAAEGAASAVGGRGGFNDQALAALVPVDLGALPRGFALEQNYPNPFNPSTLIRYRLPASTRVELSVYNAVGQRLRRLVRGTQEAGVHRVVWDGLDQDGRSLESGLYFYRLQTETAVQTRKMLLVK